MLFYAISMNTSTFISSIDDFMENTQPFVLDINGDYYNDIVYNNKNNERVVAVYSIDLDEFHISHFSEFINEECNTDESFTASRRPLAIPHSSGFLDLNKDLLSDIFIVSEDKGKRYIEIWTRSSVSPALYCIAYNEELLFKTSQIVFADMSKCIIQIKQEAMT
jgi:hypothetical protein